MWGSVRPRTLRGWRMNDLGLPESPLPCFSSTSLQGTISMKLTFRLASALTAAVVSTLVSASLSHAQVTLRWKFQPDTRHTFDIVQETTAVANVNGTDAASTTKQTMSM